MKKTLNGLLLLVMITGLLSGCNLVGNDEKSGASDGINSPVNQNPSEQTGGTNDTPIPTEDPDISNRVDVTFKEAFPYDILYGQPEKFLKEIIPGFYLGISKEEIHNMLGEPNTTRQVEGNWENTLEWIYEDVKGYQLTVIFDTEGHFVNFQLSKYLTSKGSFPKVINKSVPNPGEPIVYNELGFEEVLLGINVDEVISRYGDPEKVYITYDEMYGYDLVMEYLGVSVHVLIENENPYVHFIESNDLGVVETYRGIHVGSTVEEIYEQYGEPPYDWKETGDIIYATEDYWFAIRFVISDGKVESIDIYEAS